MAVSKRRAATILLTEEHLQKMVGVIIPRRKKSMIASRSLALCKNCWTRVWQFPDRPWHDWDEWAKGFE